ncbi:MAG TPA: glycosyltransferase [Candidatus Hydrogenedentes bacterium]|mgnify:CR=1 FL=1|nr:glycosyltransferase [Candidatus Hydrogenedentota bacterium]
MTFSVIIPAYNAETTLGACLDACLAQTRPADEVMVVDDGSADGTARIAAARGVHCIRQHNSGPAAARNCGARETRGDVLVFTDADCVPARTWLEELAAGFDEGVGAVGGTYALGNPESWLARMVHAEIAERHASLGDEVDFLGSFNVAYRREAFDRVGGFDESFRAASAEDNDLAYRLDDAGYALRFRHKACVAHIHPTRLGAYLVAQMRHGIWRVKLYRKHPGRVRRGDRYAGLGDLAAAPLALLCVAWVGAAGACAVLGWSVWPAVTAAMALGGVVTGLHVPMAVAMVRRTGEARMGLFAAMGVLRALARGVGLAGGCWRFVIRGGGA